MSQKTSHIPDRFMSDLRQILSQGRKRIGLLIGSGGPASVRVNGDGKIDVSGRPLIPDVTRLTQDVINHLKPEDQAVVDALRPEMDEDPNIETFLTRIRRLSQAIGSAKVHDLDCLGYEQLAERICSEIGKIVGASLPEEPNPFSELVSWIGGTHREHPIEIFTPNYDLLIEEAFERERLPYFDGFSGAHKPFFDPTSISEDKFSPRWSRVWKIHGSLGWDIQGDIIIRTGNREATRLIYPDHLKYDQITRLPYSALFERLRAFLMTPDSLLICSGFSFSDAHITAVLDEALASNAHTAVIAFQFKALDEETSAKQLALHRPNMSVYARDGGVISSVQGKWHHGQSQHKEWEAIRSTFWKDGETSDGQFLLGDFTKLTRFFSLTQAEGFKLPPDEAKELSMGNDTKTNNESGSVSEEQGGDNGTQS